MIRSDVLIIGAGPTGLVLALWLTKLGVNARVLDKTAEPGTTSRALAVQARTLELYRQLNLADAVVERGHKVPAVNLWVKGEPAARLPFERIGSDLSPYPFLHIFPQDRHERLLIERLEALGVSVERRTELVSFIHDLNDYEQTINLGSGDRSRWLGREPLQYGHDLPIADLPEVTIEIADGPE